MKKRTIEAHTFAWVICIFFAVSSAFGMSDEQKKEVNRIMDLPMAQLTEEAAKTLEKKYPDEDWEAYDFPQFVYTNEAVEVGYMIAVKTPQLLSKIGCVCFCSAEGHQSLLECYLIKGTSEREYADHAVECNVCQSQAMWAFLWAEAGASDEEILEMMPTKPRPRKIEE